MKFVQNYRFSTLLSVLLVFFVAKQHCSHDYSQKDIINAVTDEGIDKVEFSQFPSGFHTLHVYVYLESDAGLVDYAINVIDSLRKHPVLLNARLFVISELALKNSTRDSAIDSACNDYDYYKSALNYATQFGSLRSVFMVFHGIETLESFDVNNSAFWIKNGRILLNSSVTISSNYGTRVMIGMYEELVVVLDALCKSCKQCTLDNCDLTKPLETPIFTRMISYDQGSIFSDSKQIELNESPNLNDTTVFDFLQIVQHISKPNPNHPFDLPTWIDDNIEAGNLSVVLLFLFDFSTIYIDSDDTLRSISRIFRAWYAQFVTISLGEKYRIIGLLLYEFVKLESGAKQLIHSLMPNRCESLPAVLCAQRHLYLTLQDRLNDDADLNELMSELNVAHVLNSIGNCGWVVDNPSFMTSLNSSNELWVNLYNHSSNLNSLLKSPQVTRFMQYSKKSNAHQYTDYTTAYRFTSSSLNPIQLTLYSHQQACVRIIKRFQVLSYALPVVMMELAMSRNAGVMLNHFIKASLIADQVEVEVAVKELQVNACNIHIITVATTHKPELDNLIKSTSILSLPLTILGLDNNDNVDDDHKKTFKGSDKLTLLLHHLNNNNTIDDNDLILFVDAYDVIILPSVLMFEHVLMKVLRTEIVLSGELVAFPDVGMMSVLKGLDDVDRIVDHIMGVVDVDDHIVDVDNTSSSSSCDYKTATTDVDDDMSKAPLFHSLNNKKNKNKKKKKKSVDCIGCEFDEFPNSGMFFGKSGAIKTMLSTILNENNLLFEDDQRLLTRYYAQHKHQRQHIQLDTRGDYLLNLFGYSHYVKERSDLSVLLMRRLERGSGYRYSTSGYLAPGVIHASNWKPPYYDIVGRMSGIWGVLDDGGECGDMYREAMVSCWKKEMNGNDMLYRIVSSCSGVIRNMAVEVLPFCNS